MDMMTAIFAANKAKKDLMASGGVGYTETVDFVIVEKTKFDFAPNEDIHDLYVTEIETVNYDKITAGLQLVVHYDGEDYNCTVMSIDGIMVIGNLGVLGIGPDTGEPFLITDDGGGMLSVVAADTAETHTIGIICDTEAIHTIDPKYLPGVCLPVLDLTGLGGFNAIITDDTIDAMLTQFAADYVPAILCGFYHKELGNTMLMFTLFFIEGMVLYVADTGILSKVGLENAPPFVFISRFDGEDFWRVVSGETDISGEDGEEA